MSRLFDRKFGLRIVKFVGAVAYSVAFAELFLRLFAPVAVFPRYVTAAPYGIRINQPNRSYQHVSADVNIQIRTNSRGIRADRDFDYERTSDRRRIVVLGDSFAMGYEAELPEMFVSQMEKTLAGSGTDVEVINLSVSGHGNAEELIVLCEEGLKYNPDVVLVCWHSSDLQENVRCGLYELHLGELARRNQTYLPGVATHARLCGIPGYEWVSCHSQLYAWAREFIAVKVAKPALLAMQSIRRKKQEAGDDASYSNRLTVSLLAEIQRVTKAAGAELMILDIPNPNSSGMLASAFPNAESQPELSRSIVSPIAALTSEPKIEIFHKRSHRHFTPSANERVGEFLGKEIIKRGLLSNGTHLTSAGSRN